MKCYVMLEGVGGICPSVTKRYKGVGGLCQRYVTSFFLLTLHGLPSCPVAPQISPSLVRVGNVAPNKL